MTNWERSGRGLIGSTLGMCEGMRKGMQHLTDGGENKDCLLG